MDHSAHDHQNHDKPSFAEASEGRHAGHHTEDFLRKFWVTLALTVPIFFYSEMAHMLFGLRGPEFTGWRYMLLVLGTFVFFYCGWVFIAGAYRELRARLPGMMTLIAIAIATAYAYSAVSILAGTGHDLLFELASLIAVMLLGHWIEMRAVQGAQGALKELAKLLPDTAEVIRDGKTALIPLSGLRSGDIVLIKPGAKVPADGVIVEGRSDLNEAIITGESKLVSKTIDSEVIAGSMNGDGSLKVKVTKIGEHTFLAGVMRLVADAQASKSRLQILSDRAAFYLTIIAISTGGITFVLWLLADAGMVFATERMVAVLVIACPHALGLAVPLVASISTTMAARNGLLIRQRLALEAARTVSVVLFDKTGTLTKGEFGVDTIVSAEGYTESNVLKFAASINSQSEHSLAKAIVAEANQRGIELLPISNFERIAGKGAKARVEGADVFVGSEALFDTDVRTADILALEKQGKTVVHIGRESQHIGSIALVDIIRPESREAITALKKLGVKVAMITGDSEDVAAWVAQDLGVDQYFARVLPHEKAEKVRLLQSQGQKVAMVGDGVNDAPALTQADLGIAIGAGTNVAIESAGIILVRSDPRDIPKIIRLSKLTYAKMIQNLFWATGYNVVALPLAAGVLYAQGIILQPALAAIFMSLSTVIVAINAVFLRRKTL
ncbi:ATPase P [Candidatus Kaiserbacteria bacterium RIFCSPHIGHO2_02_FULL_54_11b]|uniref:ATPase P n=2 Tax=Candidatus Kaiseribacteriota TaxID=1752734 RepID=A0A1F6CMN0_9BACT|nr:MAG: ATPase P [Candidatus Kaiserbacteria bacterium RIFCSPHIGHO2_01_FULL_54_36b]OGG64759.1 MAG: ATPase P [Candidatus Kaiserbacteria bacterium RIFCSPHIGHO2_02_FULL_54_11b]